MHQILPYIQISVSVLIIGAILLQQRSTDVGASFGGSSASFTTRRGLEKVLFVVTIVLGTVYFASTLASLILR